MDLLSPRERIIQNRVAFWTAVCIAVFLMFGVWIGITHAELAGYIPGYNNLFFNGTSTSDGNFSTTYSPTGAFDNDYNVWFATSSAGTHWVKYQLPVAQIVNTIQLMSISNAVPSVYSIKNYSVEGSNDDSNYTLLTSGYSTTTKQAYNTNISGYWIINYFTNTTAYKYYRFNFLDSWRIVTGVGEVEGYNVINPNDPMVNQTLQYIIYFIDGLIVLGTACFIYLVLK